MTDCVHKEPNGLISRFILAVSELFKHQGFPARRPYTRSEFAFSSSKNSGTPGFKLSAAKNLSERTHRSIEDSLQSFVAGLHVLFSKRVPRQNGGETFSFVSKLKSSHSRRRRKREN